MGLENASASYKPCGCGVDCDWPKEGEPCWGQVTAVEEVGGGDDWGWLHACEGHEECNFGEPYKPEQRGEEKDDATN